MDEYFPTAVSSALHTFFGAISDLEPYFRWTALIGPEYFDENYGYKKAHVFLFCMLATYPLGLIMHLLPYGQCRHVFSFVSGVILSQICWGVHWIHNPLTSSIVYLILLYCPGDRVQRVAPIFVMAYMTIAHFQHQYHNTDYLGMDIYFTCSQMILTQKLYMLAYNLHDGYLIAMSEKLKEKEDDNKHACSISPEAVKAAQSCSEFAIQECPSPLEYLGYVFCFSTVLVGPAFEFSQYQAACNGSLLYTFDKQNKHKQCKGKYVPNNILPTVVPFLKCSILIMFSSMFDRHCNYRRLVMDWFFEDLTLKQRFIFNWFTNFVQRQKVYFTWLLAEGSNNVWYAGFDGYDKVTGEPKGWTVARGADIWALETCESIKVGTKAWNKKTSQWLLRYVYIRNRNRLAIVYAVSAIWHGFYPGYYMLAFIIWAMSHCERLGRRKISPYFSPKKWSLYGVTCMVTLHTLGSYATTAFFLRSFQDVMENWQSQYYFGHVAVLVYYLTVRLLPDHPSFQQKRQHAALESSKLTSIDCAPSTLLTHRIITSNNDTFKAPVTPSDESLRTIDRDSKYS